MAKLLKELAALVPGAGISGNAELTIQSIVHDSRQVIPGTMFVCLAGAKVDGHDYIDQAYERGAIAILTDRAEVKANGMTIVTVPDTRRAMQAIVPYFFDYPGKKLRMIGVTGTNGKTTTTYLIREILRKAGYQVGVIGTIQVLIGDSVLPIKNTTPDVIELQSTLAKMVNSKMDYAVMEVSSHALALGRIAGCEFDVGVFTNMTRDHLDFHGSFENYLNAKSLLFDMLSQPGAKKNKTAVINCDDPVADKIMDRAKCRKLSYAIDSQADLKAEQIDIQAKGTHFILRFSQSELPLHLKITGKFNVYNVLAAAGVALTEKVKPEVIKQALESFQSVPGRFELIDVGQPYSVIVDYAHTPDGLENILKTARHFAKQRIIIVFGCGGDRDRTKRPIMGRLAAEYADVVIATSDNPRTENPETILAEVERGILEQITPEKIYNKIVDRRQAIKTAIGLAKADDIVIIAGKGHETYQILKDKTIDFDDREVARAAIREMK